MVSKHDGQRGRRECSQGEHHVARYTLTLSASRHHADAIFVFLLSVLPLMESQEREGAWCVNEDGNDGICRPLRHCPYLESRADVYNGAGRDTQDLCNYGSNGAIVCCPTVTPPRATSGLGKPSTRAPPRPATRQRPRPPTPRPSVRIIAEDTVNERISEKKCQEYMNSLDRGVTVLRGDVSDTWCRYPPPRTELIVGGTAANPGEYPHMAALGYLLRGQVKWLCGGSLISPNYVLTAGHCLRREGGALIAVSLGGLEVTTMSKVTAQQMIAEAGETSNMYPVAESLRHPNFTLFSHYNDIALVRLAVPVSFDVFVRPACLSTDTNTDGIKKAVASGFGHTQYLDYSSTRLLRHVTLDVYQPEVCNQVFSAVVRTRKLSQGIVDGQICAGHLEGGKDTCDGDSGGPLQVRDKNDKCIIRIIGVTSFGTAICGLKNAAALYTSVANYLPWIEGVVWQS